MCDYWTAAEQRVVLGRRTLGAGGLYGDGAAAPVGLCHAVAAGEARTVCGKDLDGLYRFESTPFSRPSIRHCPECADRLRLVG